MPGSEPFLIKQAYVAQDGFAITPSDGTALATPAQGIYVGITGDVTIITSPGTTLLFKAVPAGMIIPVSAAYVKATGTTATNLIGLI